MKPYGLVLAGGGGKGAYQLGAWKAMRELGVQFNAVAGVSVGAINGALVVQDDYLSAEALWNEAELAKGVNFETPLKDPNNLFSVKNYPALLREILKNRGFDASPVKDFLSQYIDEEKIRAAGLPFGLVTVPLSQGSERQPELFLSDIPQGELLDYILASASIPLANNIGPQGEKFLDGGIYDNTPVSMLRRSGYNRIVVVDIASIKGVNHNLDFQNCEVVYIRPHNIDDLGASFDFSSEMNEKRKQLGYLDAKKAFCYLLGKIYYFEPEVFRALVERFGFRTFEQMEDLAYLLGIDTLRVYTAEAFLADLQREFCEKQELLRQNEQISEKEPNGAYEKEWRNSFLRRFVQRRNENEYKEAIKALEQLIDRKEDLS